MAHCKVDASDPSCSVKYDITQSAGTWNGSILKYLVSHYRMTSSHPSMPCYTRDCQETTRRPLSRTCDQHRMSQYSWAEMPQQVLEKREQHSPSTMSVFAWHVKLIPLMGIVERVYAFSIRECPRMTTHQSLSCQVHRISLPRSWQKHLLSHKAQRREEPKASEGMWKKNSH